MKLQVNAKTPTVCGVCELWSPDRHIMTSLTGLCEKYGVMIPRHTGVCLWRETAPLVELKQNILEAYKRFKERHRRPEIGGIPHEVPIQTEMQSTFDYDPEPHS